jgi:hypothetical protein
LKIKTNTIAISTVSATTVPVLVATPADTMETTAVCHIARTIAQTPKDTSTVSAFKTFRWRIACAMKTCIEWEMTAR